MRKKRAFQMWCLKQENHGGKVEHHEHWLQPVLLLCCLTSCEILYLWQIKSAPYSNVTVTNVVYLKGSRMVFTLRHLESISIMLFDFMLKIHESVLTIQILCHFLINSTYCQCAQLAHMHTHTHT